MQATSKRYKAAGCMGYVVGFAGLALAGGGGLAATIAPEDLTWKSPAAIVIAVGTAILCVALVFHAYAAIGRWWNNG